MLCFKKELEKSERRSEQISQQLEVRHSLSDHLSILSHLVSDENKQ